MPRARKIEPALKHGIAKCPTDKGATFYFTCEEAEASKEQRVAAGAAV